MNELLKELRVVKLDLRVSERNRDTPRYLSNLEELQQVINEMSINKLRIRTFDKIKLHLYRKYMNRVVNKQLKIIREKITT